MTKELPTLAPCPYCGASGDSLVTYHEPGTVLHPWHRIECDHCGAKGPGTDRGTHQEAWNRRTQSATVVAPGVTKVDPGFRWDHEAKHHVPTLLVEFTPCPLNSGSESRGWKDRDALAAAISTQPVQAQGDHWSAKGVAHDYDPEVDGSTFYDLESVDNAVHAVTHDEGEDDSVTVLERVALALENRFGGASVWEVFDRLEAATAPAVDRGRSEAMTLEALRDFLHFARQRWQNEWTYTDDECIARWVNGDFPYKSLAASAPSQAEPAKRPFTYKSFDLAAFAAALQRAADARSVTAKEISQATGVSETTLSRMKSGERAPDAASLAALSAWAGLNPANFCAPSQAGSCQASAADELVKRLNFLRIVTDEFNLKQIRLIANDVFAIAAPPAGRTLTAAAQDVLAERERQVSVEGYAPEADDAYELQELPRAAATYALLATGDADWRVTDHWPWAEHSLKKSNPRRMLIKAGALILAEIERLDRAASSTTAGERE